MVRENIIQENNVFGIPSEEIRERHGPDTLYNKLSIIGELRTVAWEYFN